MAFNRDVLLLIMDNEIYRIPGGGRFFIKGGKALYPRYSICSDRLLFR